jgi:hypothetical protein
MQCKLCLQEKKLCDSHIIPEFFFRQGYDDKHRLLVLSKQNIGKTKFIQKGLREKLLCKDCESFLCKEYENYFAKLWYIDNLLPKEALKKHYIYKGIDYTKFKLLLLSILWRASISSRPEFSQIQLGEHQEIIRNMILSRNAGDQFDYIIFGSLLYPDNNDKSIMHGLFASPTQQLINNIPVVRFVFGGCIWHYFVTNEKVMNHPTISKKGKLILGSKSFLEVDTLKKPFIEFTQGVSDPNSDTKT